MEQRLVTLQQLLPDIAPKMAQVLHLHTYMHREAFLTDIFRPGRDRL